MTGRTTVIVPVPELDTLIGELRRRYDPDAVRGLGAHITLISPWVPITGRWDPHLATLKSVAAVFQERSAELVEVGHFRRAVWLALEPEEFFICLGWEIHRNWPEIKPTSGVLNGKPHLTVANDVRPELVEPIIRASIGHLLPIRICVTHIDTIVRSPERHWKQVSHHPLRAAEAPYEVSDA